MARGDFFASLSVISLTAESSWSWGTTRLMTPNACSCVAVHRSPSISISSRTLRGTFRDRIAWIIIGQIPTLISGVPNVAVSVETRRSHEQASPRPPASAWPLMRPTMGLPRPAMSVNSSTKSSRLRCRSRSLIPPSKLERSAPAQKALSPAPDSTTTWTAGSCLHHENAAARSRSIAPERGLRCSGRLSVTVATRSSTESSTCSRTGISVTRLILWSCVLAEDANSDGDSDQDQHGAADLLAPFLNPPAQPVAELEAGERHRDADDADRRSGQQYVDPQAAQREPDRQVVDAQGQGGDDQAMRLKATRGLLLALDLSGLKDRVETGEDQDAARDITSDLVPDVAGNGLS